MFLHLNKLSINKLISCEYHFEVEIARRVMININYILKQWHSSELKRNNLYSFSVFTLSLSRLVNYAAIMQTSFSVVIYMLT